MTDELWRQSATDLANMIKAKQVSSREVIESHLQRIEAVNGSVNAVTVVLAESALANKVVALVTEVPGVNLPKSTIAAIRAAGDALSSSGWEVQEVQPPDLAKVHDSWAYVLSMDFVEMIPEISSIMSTGAIGLLQAICDRYDVTKISFSQLHAERAQMCRAWSRFFENYPLVVGPAWTDIPFLHDADIDSDTGMELTNDRLRFITPANLLGIPAVAVPTGVADGLPTGVQVYADKWREDLCLTGAEIIEAHLGQICPIDPL